MLKAMKNNLGIRSLLLLALLMMVAGGCNQTGVAPQENPSDNKSVSWTFSVTSGNWTTADPQEFTTTLDSTGLMTWKTPEGDTTSATISAEDLARFNKSMATVDLKNQKTLELAEGCAGGGAQVLTYKEAAGVTNTFSIVGGCGAELKDTDAALAAFMDTFNSIIALYYK